MPDSTLRWQSFNQKKPYFIATVFSVVLVAFAVGFLFEKLAVNKEEQIAQLDPKLQDKTHKSENFKKAYTKLKKTQAEAEQLTAWMDQRFYWGDFMSEMRGALIRSELDIKKKLAPQNPGVEVGIWVEQMISSAATPVAAQLPGAPGMTPNPRGYRGEVDTIRNPMPMPMPEMPAAQPAAEGGVAATNNVITLICRAVSLTSVDSTANTTIAYAVENEIKNSPLVDAKATQLSPNISQDEPNGTFTFTVNVTLLNPLKF